MTKNENRVKHSNKAEPFYRELQQKWPKQIHFKGFP